MATTQTIRVSSIQGNITPLAFQYYAKDFFNAYLKHKGGSRFSPARLFLLSRSLELAAKSLHLAKGRDAAGIRRLGHSLERACDAALLASFGIRLTDHERAHLAKANQYYKGKGFEYFLFEFPGVPFDRSGPQQALMGWPDLPDESVLESIVSRMIDYPMPQ